MQPYNVELMRRVAAAANKRDPSALRDLLAPGVFWHAKNTAPDIAGTYHGIPEVREFFAGWVQAWEEWDWQYPEMRAVGDTVVARMRLWGRGRLSGVESKNDVWQLWTFRGGKVIYYEDFATREQALEAVGLSERTSQRSVEVIGAVYDRYREGDFRASAELLDPHVILVLDGTGDWGLELPEGGRYVGREAIADYTRELVRPWTGFTMEAEEITEAGDSVLVNVRQRGTGAASGVPSELRYFTLWTFRGDKVIRIESFRDRAVALEAAGLSE